MNKLLLTLTALSLIYGQNLWAQPESPATDIEVILDDQNSPVPSDGSTGEEGSDFTAPEGEGSEEGGTYRIMDMPLNDFAAAMAQRSGLTYVYNPLVTGDVSGRFNSDNPLRMLKAAARANGYSVLIQDNVLELHNIDTLSALPQQTYTRTLKYLRVPGPREENGSKIVELFSGLLSEDAYLQFDNKSNTIVAKDNENNIALLDALINRLDIAKPNVLTSVTILEVNVNPQVIAGLNWQTLFSDGGYTMDLAVANQIGNVFIPLAGATLASAVPTFNNGSNNYAVAVQPGTARFALNAVERAGLAETKSQFFVSTEDNEAGRTIVARKEPIPNFTSNQQTGGFDISGFEYEDIGSTLEVVPTLLPGGIVRLQIKPKLSTSTETRSFSGSGSTGNGTAASGFNAVIPIIQERSTDVTVRVKLGTTLLLGGLKEGSLTDNSQGIPILKDIPILGYMFGQKNYRKGQRNLVLVVEPSLLDPNDVEGMGANLEKLYESMKIDKDFMKKPISDLDRRKEKSSTPKKKNVSL
jgi:type II secretory pathway component GspD/PulD (secretin)